MNSFLWCSFLIVFVFSFVLFWWFSFKLNFCICLEKVLLVFVNIWKTLSLFSIENKSLESGYYTHVPVEKNSLNFSSNFILQTRWIIRYSILNIYPQVQIFITLLLLMMHLCNWLSPDERTWASVSDCQHTLSLSFLNLERQRICFLTKM